MKITGSECYLIFVPHLLFTRKRLVCVTEHFTNKNDVFMYIIIARLFSKLQSC